MSKKITGDGKFDINKFKISELGQRVQDNVKDQIFDRLGSNAFRNENIRNSQKLGSETADFHSVTATDSHLHSHIHSATKISPLISPSK